MRRWICGALAALALVTTAQAEDRLDRVREKGELEVAVYRDFPPWSYAADGGQYVGVDVDIARELAQRLGVKLKLRPFLAGETMDDDLRNQVWKGHYLGGGIADLMLHAGIDPEYVRRNDKADLFGAYQHESVAVIYRARGSEQVGTPLALLGRRIGVEVDSISDYYLSGAFNGRLRGDAVRKASVAEAVAAFQRGELDAVMAPRGELEGALHRSGAQAREFELTEFTGIFRTAWDIGMAVKAGNPELRAALQSALAAMREDGRLGQLLQAHGLHPVAPQPAALAAK